MLRLELTGELQHLEEAVELATISVKSATDTDPHLPAFLNNLGNYFESQYDHKGVTEDLDEALPITQLAIDSALEGDPTLSEIGAQAECTRRSGSSTT